jgi:hypothetical protein
MHGEGIQMLIARYLDGIASPDEIELVDEWYNAFDTKPSFYFNHSSTLTDLIDEKFAVLQLKVAGK